MADADRRDDALPGVTLAGLLVDAEERCGGLGIDQGLGGVHVGRRWRTARERHSRHGSSPTVIGCAAIAYSGRPSTLPGMSRGQATPNRYMAKIVVAAADVRPDDTVIDDTDPAKVRVQRQRTNARGQLGWRLRYSDPHSKLQRETTYYGTYEQAVRKLASFEQASQSTAVALAARLKAATLEQWAVDWLRMRMWKHAPAGKFAGELRPHSTFAKERNIIEAYLLPGLGPQTKLRSVTLQQLRAWIGGLTLLDEDGERGSNPMMPSSKSTVSNVARLFFRDAQRELGLPANPAVGLPSTWGTDTSARRIIVPNLAEVEKLARALDESWPLPAWANDLYGPEGQGRGDIVRLLAFSGMRWEELAAMPADLVHRAEKLMDVRYTATESGGKRRWVDNAKTPAGERYLVVVPQLFDVIDRLDAVRQRGMEREAARAARRAARGSREPAAPETGLWSLLVSGERGGFLSYGAWRKKLDVARQASGVDLTAHELRHIAASILFAAKGDDWKLIQEQMGHTSLQETERIYKHVFRGDRSAVARMLGAKITELQEGSGRPANPHRW